MAKIGIFYGSSTGYTADVATRIAQALGIDLTDVHDVAKTAPSALGDYDTILLGASTWGAGDVQDDMIDFLDGASELALPGKKIAYFGCGDVTMGDTFCAAVKHMYDRMLPTGATPIAPFNVDGYEATSSPAIVDGQAVGLLIDEVNHADLTDARIAAWAALIK